VGDYKRRRHLDLQQTTIIQKYTSILLKDSEGRQLHRINSGKKVNIDRMVKQSRLYGSCRMNPFSSYVVQTHIFRACNTLFALRDTKIERLKLF